MSDLLHLIIKKEDVLWLGNILFYPNRDSVVKWKPHNKLFIDIIGNRYKMRFMEARIVETPLLPPEWRVPQDHYPHIIKLVASYSIENTNSASVLMDDYNGTPLTLYVKNV